MAAASLNELCWTQYQAIVFFTALSGNPYGSGFFTQVLSVPSKPLHVNCGERYGTAALVNGGSTGSPAVWAYDEQSGETRGVACVRNLFHWSCSTHLAPGATGLQQSAEYLDFVNLLAFNGTPVYAAGDFNIVYAPTFPENLWYVAWTYTSGFAEADFSLNRATFSSVKIDYAFRRNPASWSHSAYVAWFSISDHAWLQGYV